MTKKTDLLKMGARWHDRLQAAEKREQAWLKDAEKAEAAFLCDDNNDNGFAPPQFNILHSNVETIVPAIINSAPVPEIRPRHGRKEDEIAKQAADIFERAIEVQIDDNRLEAEIEAGAQDAFMAGRDIVRVKFDADEREDGTVTGERLIYEVVSWRDYREGPAKRWSGVPWVAYRHEVTEEERKRLEDPEIRKAYADQWPSEEGDLDCTIWEIWCKENRKVYFLIEDTHTILSIKDDPLGLKGFFPQGAPVQPITATGKRTPVCPYSVYRTLAEELDRTTKRINAIMKGLKVRGGVAGDAGDIAALAAAGDNELVPIANLENLAATGGIDKAIMWWPVETAIAVLKELYVQRESTKQSIYEITGISDIVRGASRAQETATAQQIKTEWGSLRIKKLQRLIERQVRDLFVISAEIIGSKFSTETLQVMTGIPIAPEVAQFLQSPLDHYRINIESDSTIRADLTKSRSEMAEFLRGTAEFFGTMAPIVATAPQAAAPLANMYSAFARQFNLGRSAEDALDQFVAMAEQAASQPQADPNAGAQAELQAKMQQELAKLQAEMERAAQDRMSKEKMHSEDLALKARMHEDEITLKARQENLNAAKIEREFELRASEAAQRDTLERTKLSVQQRAADSEANIKMAEVNTRDMDMASQRAQELMGGLVDAIGQKMDQGNAELLQAIQTQNQAMADGISAGFQQLATIMSAKRRAIRGEDGKLTGESEVVLPEAMN